MAGLIAPTVAAVDEWDDFCLPDDVLNAMLDAAGPASVPPSRPLAPPAAAAPSMFDSFYAPGPVREPRPPGVACPPALGAPARPAYTAAPATAARQQVPQPPAYSRPSHPAPPAWQYHQPPSVPALAAASAPAGPGACVGAAGSLPPPSVELRRCVGEAEVLRARLSEAQAGLSESQLREQALQVTRRRPARQPRAAFPHAAEPVGEKQTMHNKTRPGKKKCDVAHTAAPFLLLQEDLSQRPGSSRGKQP
jgi:hypothetical protein